MNKITLLTLCLFLFSNTVLQAQTWNNGGNTLSANGSIGTKSSHSLLFKTSNIERGRITNGGNWGIGTTSPGGKFHINSAAGQNPLRVQVNAVTKFLVHSGGGVAIGVNVPPPANGLLVNGNVAIGTTTPEPRYRLHVVQEGLYNTGIGAEGHNGVVGVNRAGDGTGVFGLSTDGYGVFGLSSNYYGVLGTTGNPSSFAGYFNGDVFTTGTYQPSDEKLKQNISDVKNATAILSQLKPKHYDYKTEGSFAQMNLPQGNQYGLLSQDVEKVLPGLIKEVHLNPAQLESLKDPTSTALRAKAEKEEVMDFKAVNYTGLIPIMIQAMQEQQAKMQEQEAKINTLTEEIVKLKAGNSTGGNFNITNKDLLDISLEQNSPNPAKQSTTIKYTIPANTKAQILVYEAASGKLVKTLQAPSSGQVQMNGQHLPAGIYIYNLMVEGKLAASKQMVISE